MADRDALYDAYMRNFLSCSKAVYSPPLRDAWVRQRLQSAETRAWHFANLRVTPLPGDLVLVGEVRGSHAVMLDHKTGLRLDGSPCGSASKFVRYFPEQQRIAVAFNDVKKVELSQASKGVELLRTSEAGNLLYVYDLATSTGISIPIPDAEEARDVHLAADGAVYVLTSKNQSLMRHPANWITMIAGHGIQTADVFMIAFTRDGDAAGRKKLAGSIEIASVRFVSDQVSP